MRKVFFWLHLAAGVSVGLLVLLMSVTGVLLTYERQLIEWSDRAFRNPNPSGQPLAPTVLLNKFKEQQPEAVATALTLKSDPEAPVLLAAGQTSYYLDAYSGAVLGSPTTRVRSLMSSLRNWHRYVALAGEWRPTGKALMGWANVAFLFIVLSGIYLWLPAAWTAAQVRAVAWFRGGLSGRARDFNWHNVIGIWSAVPLAIVIVTAMPISFPWANAAVYRLMGEEPPAPAGGAAPAANANAARVAAQPAGEAAPRRAPEMVVPAELDARWEGIEQNAPGWRSINLRLPSNANGQLVFAVDRGNGGQPQLRSTVTLDGRTGEVVRSEAFSDQTPGRRLRSWTRFTHTGEYYGIGGQTIAGIVTGGAVVLVYTGLALALRRFAAWIKRSRQLPAARRAA